MTEHLTSEAVEKIFMDCLYTDGEDMSDHVPVEGILNTFGLHPGRLESHRAEVTMMLADLPDEFKKSVGGGWSFLNACLTKDGEQWTGLHMRMDQLFVLGMGLKLVVCQLPREMWAAFPGGMPYYEVLDE